MTKILILAVFLLGGSTAYASSNTLLIMFVKAHSRTDYVQSESFAQIRYSYTSPAQDRIYFEVEKQDGLDFKIVERLKEYGVKIECDDIGQYWFKVTSIDFITFMNALHSAQEKNELAILPSQFEQVTNSLIPKYINETQKELFRRMVFQIEGG